MKYGWVIPLILLVAIMAGLGGWYFCRPGSRRRQRRGWVANSGYVRNLPSFRARVNRNKLVATFALSAACLAVGVNAVITAGPVTTKDAPKPFNARDVLFCFDNSSSMIEEQGLLINTFAEVSKTLNGERLGMSSWAEFLIVVFPMSNDYNMVRTRLDEVNTLFKDGSYGWAEDGSYRISHELWEFLGGTDNPRIGHAPTPDALATCAMSFNTEESTRSRIIFFLTSYAPSDDEAVYTLDDALELATSRDVTVHIIRAGESDPIRISELQQAAANHGGKYYEARDSNTQQDVAAEITWNEMVDSDSPDKIEIDTPEIWFTLLIITVTIMLAIGIAVRP